MVKFSRGLADEIEKNPIALLELKLMGTTEKQKIRNLIMNIFHGYNNIFLPFA